jgi:hypothetical protein
MRAALLLPLLLRSAAALVVDTHVHQEGRSHLVLFRNFGMVHRGVVRFDVSVNTAATTSRAYIVGE